MSDFWSDLGLSGVEDLSKIKKAYREKALASHPDRGGSEAEFRRIHHAYKMLTDPSYRHKEEEVNRPVAIEVYITLEQAVFGVIVNNEVSKAFKASDSMPEAQAQTQLFTFRHHVKGWAGRPIVINESVPIGKITKSIKFVYLVSEHQRYKPHPRGMVVNETIDVMTALKGGAIEVQTLFGVKKVRIKPGTNVGDEYAISHHHLGVLIVRISGIKVPSSNDLRGQEEYKDLGIDWNAEDQADRKEMEDFQRTFDRIVFRV